MRANRVTDILQLDTASIVFLVARYESGSPTLFGTSSFLAIFNVRDVPFFHFPKDVNLLAGVAVGASTALSGMSLAHFCSFSTC